MAELKPCPFCGGIPKVHACDASGAFYAGLETAVLYGRVTKHRLIRCSKCGIRTKAYLTENGLFKAWNRRTGE